jgi:tetratricopeptide (TPR) repeat protein
MKKPQIDAAKITSPIQLLATWFVTLIVITGAFLGAAHVITEPAWIPAMFAIAAVANIPVFLTCMFLLQTKFRPEMLQDKYYLEHVEKTNRATSEAGQLKDILRTAGVDALALAEGKLVLSGDLLQQIRTHVERIDQALHSSDKQRTDYLSELPAEALYGYAEGLAAEQRWLAAAEVLERYAILKPQDWQAHHLRSVCYANARGGQQPDLGALRAGSDAIANIPADLARNVKARLYGYRGAILKRLRRLDEAESELLFANHQATKKYEKIDTTYNLACVYAMQGRREDMLKAVQQIKDSSDYMRLISSHLQDYFTKFASDPDLLRLIAATN